MVVGSSNFAKGSVLRYAADGTLDASFSGDGKVFTKLGGFGGYTAVALQSDDRIVATGEGVLQGEYISEDAYAVIRYTTGGALDPTFGGDGKVFTAFSAGFSGGQTSANDVGLQSDGKVLVAGTVPGAKGSGDIAVARYGTKATAVLPKPDLLISAGGGFVGNDRYNDTGRHQTIAKKVARGHPATFTIEIQNDGNALDSIVIQGLPGAPGISVKYLAGGSSITRPVEFGQYSKALAPGGSATIKMVVHVSTKAKVGKVVKLPVAGHSLSDGDKRDVVAAKIRVV